jgi:DNA-directed RNA polymerase specialized sigma24 family protein
VGNVDTGQHIQYDGLLRAARLAASIAGATGSDVDEIADEAMARLLLQDGPVNNSKAWVRSTATRLAGQRQTRERIRVDQVLDELTALERSVVIGHRTGYPTRVIAQELGATEDAVAVVLAEANRKLRRSSRRFADMGC